eukprot:GHVN01091846.1.p1 GENE.GHVN01091846.1~~GHVN01091846.1.p1  ORF type:complete len:164 (+),score=22.32 GHVN01091846.1:194-685(+)
MEYEPMGDTQEREKRERQEREAIERAHREGYERDIIERVRHLAQGLNPYTELNKAHWERVCDELAGAICHDRGRLVPDLLVMERMLQEYRWKAAEVGRTLESTKSQCMFTVQFKSREERDRVLYDNFFCVITPIVAQPDAEERRQQVAVILTRLEKIDVGLLS